jgi:hypothetical protein
MQVGVHFPQYELPSGAVGLGWAILYGSEFIT